MIAAVALILAAHQSLTWDIPYLATADGYRLYWRPVGATQWAFTGCELPIMFPRLPDDETPADVADIYPQRCLSLAEGTPVEFVLRAYRGEDESGNSNVVAIDWPYIVELP